MAISWGSYDTSGGLGIRIGLEYSWSTVYHTSTSATLTVKVYTQNYGGSYSDSQSLAYSGSAGSGSTAFTNNDGTSAVLRSTQTYTYNYASWEYGSSPGSRSFRADLSGAFNGVTPAHSIATFIPARPVDNPAAPTSVVATRVSDTNHTISWTNNATSGEPYDTLEVHRWNNVVGSYAKIATLSGTATSYSWGGPVADARYRYAVRAINDAGGSPFGYSGFLSNTPAAPTTVTATPGTGGTKVTWTNKARWIEGNKVERQEDSGAWVAAATLGATATSWTHVDPNTAVTHRYRIAATVTGPTLQSTWSTSNTVTLAAPPNAPTDLEPSTAFDATEAHTLTWVHNPVDGSAQTGFQVRHRLAGGAWTEVAKVVSEVSEWTLPAGTYANGDTVEWEVRTWGIHADPGPYSATASMLASARPTVAINSPDPLADWTTSTLTVTWGYDQAQGSAQSSWQAQLLADGVAVETLAGSGATSAAEFAEVLGNGTAWTVQVRAQSEAGTWSLWDAVEFTVVYAAPPAPVVSVAWDLTQAAMVVTVTNQPMLEGDAEPVSNLVQRMIGEDTEWVTIATGLPVSETPTAVTDPIPHLTVVNRYRAVAVSALPSSASSAPVDAPIGPLVDGRCFINAGPGFAVATSVWAEVSMSAGRDKVLRQFAGRRFPVEFAGQARSRTWSLRSTTLYGRDMNGFDAAALAEEVEDIAGVTCYRDVLGNRLFASMGPVDASYAGISGTVGWSMAEVDHTEGVR